MLPIFNRETQCKLFENETKQLAEAAVFSPAAAGTINSRDCGFYLVTHQLQAKTN